TSSEEPATQDEWEQEELVVTRLRHREAALSEKRQELLSAVAPPVGGHQVARAPQEREGWCGQNEQAAGRQNACTFAQCCPIVHVLEDVECDNEIDRRVVERQLLRLGSNYASVLA